MSRPLVRRRCEQRELAGAFLLDDGVNLHLLDGVAAEVWRSVDGRRDRDGVVGAVCDGAPDLVAATREVAAFLDRLVDADLVGDGDAGRFEPTAGTGWVESDDGGVALAVYGSGERLVLSPGASAVWELAVSGLAEAEIASALHSETGADAHVLGDLVAQVVLELLDVGALRRVW